MPGMVGKGLSAPGFARRGGEKPRRIGMTRLGEERLRRCLLDDAAGIHHDDLLAHFRDHAEIVGDQQDRDIEVALQLFQSSRICAWIVTSSAVVGSSAIRSFGRHIKRHGDHHTLAQAAR